MSRKRHPPPKIPPPITFWKLSPYNKFSVGQTMDTHLFKIIEILRKILSKQFSRGQKGKKCMYFWIETPFLPLFIHKKGPKYKNKNLGLWHSYFIGRNFCRTSGDKLSRPPKVKLTPAGINFWTIFSLFLCIFWHLIYNRVSIEFYKNVTIFAIS